MQAHKKCVRKINKEKQKQSGICSGDLIPLALGNSFMYQECA